MKCYQLLEWCFFIFTIDFLSKSLSKIIQKLRYWLDGPREGIHSIWHCSRNLNNRVDSYTMARRQKKTTTKNSTPGVKMLSPFKNYFWFLDYSEISLSTFLQRETKCTQYKSKSRKVGLLKWTINSTPTTSSTPSLDNAMLHSKDWMVLSTELERFRPRNPSKRGKTSRAIVLRRSGASEELQASTI